MKKSKNFANVRMQDSSDFAFTRMEECCDFGKRTIHISEVNEGMERNVLVIIVLSKINDLRSELTLILYVSFYE